MLTVRHFFYCASLVIGLICSQWGSAGTISIATKEILAKSVCVPGECHGRYGDQMLRVSKALWISKKYGTEFGTAFNLNHYKCLKLRDRKLSSKQRKLPKIYCDNEKQIRQIQEPSLIIINNPFRCDNWDNAVLTQNWHDLKRDHVFLDELRTLILPRISTIAVVKPPNDHYTVALHIRRFEPSTPSLYSDQFVDYNTVRELKKNSSGLNQYADKRYPGKFHPLQYFLDQLEYLSNVIRDKPIYVYVFTDDPRPREVTSEIKSRLTRPSRFKFAYRERSELNKYRETLVFSDFLSMLNFDCIIRPQESAFSEVAHLIGHHKKAIYPKKWEWKGKCLTMTEVCIEDANHNVEVIHK